MQVHDAKESAMHLGLRALLAEGLTERERERESAGVRTACDVHKPIVACMEWFLTFLSIEVHFGIGKF